ncbi:DUF1653 domain-containing protein [Candidatus Woesearchaeota archaeon]|nr:MAG: DUF1653 domain-containing protein [Candidatus Woesearchaeota archaeon]
MKLGKYKHFKGNVYEVIAVAKHSETLEDLVIYKSLTDSKFWARPKKMFLEKVKVGDKLIPRFEAI